MHFLFLFIFSQKEKLVTAAAFGLFYCLSFCDSKNIAIVSLQASREIRRCNLPSSSLPQKRSFSQSGFFGALIPCDTFEKQNSTVDRDLRNAAKAAIGISVHYHSKSRSKRSRLTLFKTIIFDHRTLLGRIPTNTEDSLIRAGLASSISRVIILGRGQIDGICVDIPGISQPLNQPNSPWQPEGT